MIFTTLSGHPRDVSMTAYKVDWERKVSRPQKRVKDFLRPYWEGDAVYEEVRIPGCLFRVDLINVNKAIMVEVSPIQHHTADHWFHGGSMAKWKASLKRDIQKERWAELNQLTYVELTQDDLDTGLSAELFLSRFGVTL